jgi:hypothetical protein
VCLPLARSLRGDRCQPTCVAVVDTLPFAAKRATTDTDVACCGQVGFHQARRTRGTGSREAVRGSRYPPWVARPRGVAGGKPAPRLDLHGASKSAPPQVNALQGALLAVSVEELAPCMPSTPTVTGGFGYQRSSLISPISRCLTASRRPGHGLAQDHDERQDLSKDLSLMSPVSAVFEPRPIM